MLNYILAPLGIVLMALGVGGLYWAIRGGRPAVTPPDDREPPDPGDKTP